MKGDRKKDDQRISPQEQAAFRQQIIDSIDKVAFFQSYLNGEILSCKSDGWLNKHVHCLFHNDSGKANLDINLHTGGFKCFACGKSGSIFDFWCLVKGLDPKIGFQDALISLASTAGIPIPEWGAKVSPTPLDATKTVAPKSYAPKLNKAAATDATQTPIKRSVAEKFHKELQAVHYKYLSFFRGLTDKTISKYLIGWNSALKYKDREGKWQKGRYTIPIFGRDSKLRNIRTYTSDAEPEYKMINTKGYGTPPRIFPLDELLKQNWTNLIWCEGEFDTILLNQKLEEAGLSNDWGAVTNTHGCKSFELEWIEFFIEKHFIFLMDVDEAGKTAASSHATQYMLGPLSSGKFKSLKIVHLPLDGSKEFKDVTDYFMKVNGSIQDLVKLIESTQCLEPGGVNNDEATIKPIDVASFVECIKDRQYIDQHVKVPLTISGQSTKIYHATRSYRVAGCPAMSGDNCCSANTGVQIVPYGDVLFIESCMANKKQLTSALQNIACSNHKQCTVEEVEKVVMEEYFGHQVIKRLTAKENEEGRMVNSQELVTSSLYVLQPEKNVDIGPHDYVATGFVRSHPGTRQATLFIENLEPMEEDWSKFQINETTVEHLKFIQNTKVKKILEELTLGVTQIYESEDILLAVLLTYLSPLWISFNGKVERGWINSCVLGDTGTGKSATYIRISDWIELGDLFSALSGTRTGLLYSIKQKGVEWYVQIGRYVMASGKIIAVDETQETSAEDIKKMAKAMDEGWLEVSQVASGGYQTQTRTLFLMNPKGGKKISDFPYGCQAIAECFDPMFIRRIDLAVFSTGRDDYRFYNKQFDDSLAKKISLTPEILRSLIYWAWTRSINDIHWEAEATNECLEKSIWLAEIYGQADDIPLVNPQDFRTNLARLSTAFAVLSGSFSEDYEGLIVKTEHVTKMATFVDLCYSSSACNLRQHSKNSGKKKTLKDYDAIVETFDKVIDHANRCSDIRWKEGQHFLQMVLMLQQQQYIRKRDLSEQLGVTLHWVQKHIAILQMHNLVECHRGGYKTTRKYNLFLQKWQENKEIEELLDTVQEKVGKLALMTQPDEYNPAEKYSDPFYEAEYKHGA